MNDPTILTIDIPFLSQNLRDIKGSSWWNKTRKQAEQANDSCCYACGIHKTKADYRGFLYGQEIYNVVGDTAFFQRVICLCYRCYYFIDVTRLLSDDFGYKRTEEIFEHGFSILRENGLKPKAATAAAYLYFKNHSLDEIPLLLEQKEIQIKEHVIIKKVKHGTKEYQL